MRQKVKQISFQAEGFTIVNPVTPASESHGAVISALHKAAMHATGLCMGMFRTTITAMTAFAALGAAPAMADLACGSLLMPAGQLKQVSRGITAHHSGLDLVAPPGSPARAAAAGTVVFAQTYFAYGLMVDIDHGSGVVTRYAHLSGFGPGIRPGVRVAAGQQIGQVGRTGRATTNHIHFEVRINGRPVDPKPYLSLAACTPRTPTVRIEEARAPGAPYAPGFARPQAQLADAQAARSTAPAFTGPAASGPMDRQSDARPGGLLD